MVITAFINTKNDLQLDTTKLNDIDDSKVKKTKKKTKLLKQARFNTPIKKIKCIDCGLTYLPHISIDFKVHKQYHDKIINGLPISNNSLQNFGKAVLTFSIKNCETKIIKLNLKSLTAIKLTETYLDIVNKSLNSPMDNRSFTKKSGNAYGCIITTRTKDNIKTESFLIGLVTTDTPKTGYWLIHDSGKLVPNKKINVKTGISRIYVSLSYRRFGIASKLLDCVKNWEIYGIILKPWEIAFSQPSEYGGLLATSWYKLKHKSGKVLIPVFKEDECEFSNSDDA